MVWMDAAAAFLLVVAGADESSHSRRLRITNGCPTERLWIAHEAGGDIGPDEQNIPIEPLQHYDFITQNVSAARYWGKMLCDEQGDTCALGGSGGPGESCVRAPASGGHDYSRCAPPIDTKFEATFGQVGLPCDPATQQMVGCDYIDVSLVDGYTLPVSLEVMGQCTGKGDVDVEMVDCSGLSFDICPVVEKLAAAGMTVNLQAVNPQTGDIAGCYSPCSMLIDGKWNNKLSQGRRPEDPEVAPYCCPTPPETPDACRGGPAAKTEFVQVVHRSCPGVYGYAYDDAMGLLRCNANSQYRVTFYCPSPMLRARRPHQRHWQARVTVFVLVSAVASAALVVLRQRGWRLEYERLPGLETPQDAEAWHRPYEDLQGRLWNHTVSMQDSFFRVAGGMQGLVCSSISELQGYAQELQSNPAGHPRLSGGARGQTVAPVLGPSSSITPRPATSMY